MAALRKLSTLQVRVLRDGSEQAVAAQDLVPGDMILLAAGDAVGAAARLVDEASLAVAEATLTGESVPVSKNIAALPEASGLADRRNMVFAGTYVSAGRARAIVTATGIHTEVGAIARMTEGAQEPRTPLESRISQFGRDLVYASIALFFAVVALGLVHGLPFFSRGAIIRLCAVETLGSITIICSDKTGTLTRNEMTVSTLWFPGGCEVAICGVGYAPQGELSGPVDAAVLALLGSSVLCSDAALVPPEDEVAQWTVLGDPTEAALLVVAGKAGIDVGALRQQYARTAEIPFDSDTKMMATCHKRLPGAGAVYIKGAPEAVLRRCHGAGGGQRRRGNGRARAAGACCRTNR